MEGGGVRCGKTASSFPRRRESSSFHRSNIPTPARAEGDAHMGRVPATRNAAARPKSLDSRLRGNDGKTLRCPRRRSRPHVPNPESRIPNPSPQPMLALIQPVTSASVTVDGDTLGAIGPGLLALVGVEPGDGDAQVERMTQRLLGYRVFADDQGRMNRSLADSRGGLLLVSQFTLAADTRSGMRPGFSTAAAPEEAERVFSQLLARCRENQPPGVETGRFGAHMVVSLVNDGPVTFLLKA